MSIDSLSREAVRRSALLEVIVESLSDAREAARGGADRLEVVRALERGGLTPPIELVQEIAASVNLPLRVMVRANDGYTTGARERAELRRAAGRLAAMNVDGLVIGFADRGEPRLDDLLEIVDAIAGVHVTFHRAFDQLDNPEAAVDLLRGIPQVDRILTSGGDGSPLARCERLASYQRRAGDRLTIIAGGGVDESMLAEIARTHCVREVHVGRAAREHLDPARPVSADRVAHLVQVLRR